MFFISERIKTIKNNSLCLIKYWPSAWSWNSSYLIKFEIYNLSKDLLWDLLPADSLTFASHVVEFAVSISVQWDLNLRCSVAREIPSCYWNDAHIERAVWHDVTHCPFYFPTSNSIQFKLTYIVRINLKMKRKSIIK